MEEEIKEKEGFSFSHAGMNMNVDRFKEASITVCHGWTVSVSFILYRHRKHDIVSIAKDTCAQGGVFF